MKAFNSISKRTFLRLLTFPLFQFIVSCVYRKTEGRTDPQPAGTAPSVLLKSSAFLTDFEGQILVGEDEIKIEWTEGNVFPMTLQFSSDNGKTFTVLAILEDNSPYYWKIPQIKSDNAFLELLVNLEEKKSVDFSIINSVVVFLYSYPALENSGNFQQIDTWDHGVIVVSNSGAGFNALSLTCTHSGCTAQYRETEIYCSCHGSRFTKEGNVINGPESIPLKKFGTKYLRNQKKLLIY